ACFYFKAEDGIRYSSVTGVQTCALPIFVVGRSGGRAPLLALGAAGSRRIVSALLHAISGVLDRGLPLHDALDQPRAHARPSGTRSEERRVGKDDRTRRPREDRRQTA